MRLKLKLYLAMVIAALMAPSICMADLEWESKATMAFQQSPLDLAVSRDGQWIFVLVKGGTVQIYTYDRILKGTINVGSGYDRIEAGPLEDEIYLLGSKSRDLLVIEWIPNREIETLGAPYKGKVDAPVVIVEFTDFQCPYCAKLGETFKRLLELYPGKIKIVYKSYPLSNHRYAWKAAVAAMAAHRNGQFWEFHDRLFENHKVLNDQKILEIRKEFGFDTPEFDALMRTPQVRTRVAQDRAEGQSIGVRGTPAVFVNGKRLKDKTLKGFRMAIDKELK